MVCYMQYTAIAFATLPLRRLIVSERRKNAVQRKGCGHELPVRTPSCGGKDQTDFQGR
ncbi:MAG: hypothetical protein UU76_C0006G0006 [Parcubacteria group bacterium GW2011_GWC1_41_7]|nr:MAG: hypothetical protein UU76_C0006G0006 [Parcubacteria group bacterium GW2011_GWC1_41_7]